MAYYRASAQVSQSPAKYSMNNVNIDQLSIHTANKEKSDEPQSKSLVIFWVDITHWSPVFQYVYLAGGLILFMCLYGYFQELVQYGWFDRKLSLFSTLLHFVGVSIFAQLQRNALYRKVVNASQYSFTSMGTASPRVAFFYYFLLVAVKVLAQGMSNLCMTEINYPAKVLFKSANPIITMIIGVTWLRKSYPVRDYIVVTLLVLGLYIFIVSDKSGAGMPSATALGIFYVVLSMFGSAGVPMIQEYCITVYNASVEDLLYHSFLGSAIISLILSVITGELFEGIRFLLQNSSVHVWVIFIAFCTFGFAGANFGTALTGQYGALVNGITSTLRKAITLSLSFVLFPERNTMSSGKLFGAAIFFSGLLFRVFSKSDHKEGKESPVHTATHRNIPNDYLNLHKESRLDEGPDSAEDSDDSPQYIDMEDELMLMNPAAALKSKSSDKIRSPKQLGGGAGVDVDDVESRLSNRVTSNSTVQDAIHL